MALELLLFARTTFLAFFPRNVAVNWAFGVTSILLSGGALCGVQPPGAEAMADQGPKGMLAVRAVQGTKGGRAVGGEEVEVVFFHRDVPVKQVKGNLDEHGVLLIADLPVAMGLKPLVRVKHAGVLYQEAAPMLNASRPAANFDITVYEVTEEKPDWKIVMRHVVAEPADSGLAISETVIVENPADRTWLGGPVEKENRRTTVSLDLPPGAADVIFVQGFHGWCCTALDDHRLNIQMPLMPGRMTYKFAYRVPVRNGVADLRVGAPVETGHTAFFVPADAAGEPTLLQDGGIDTSPARPMRMFQGDKVPAGTLAGVVLAIGSARPVEGNGRASDGFPIGWIAGGLIIAGAGVGFVVWRRRGRGA